MEKNRINLTFEVALGIFSLVLAFFLYPIGGLDEKTIWLAGVIIGIGTFLLIGIKIYFHLQKKSFNDISRNLMQEFTKGPGLANSLSYRISIMKEPNLSYAREILAETAIKIDKVERDIIPLCENDYFIKIIDEAKSLINGDNVYAVNTFEERRFFVDPREEKFFIRNIEAVKRGANIERIFIYDERRIDTQEGKERLAAIKKNQDMGISVFVVFKTHLLGQKNLFLDWVMFDGKKPRLYVDFQDKVDEARVSEGELRLNMNDITEFKKTFEILKENTISEAELDDLFNKLI